MSIEEKEERIIKLSEERLDLIKKGKELNNNGGDELTNMLIAVDISRRLFEINQEIEELIASAKPNRC